MPTYLHAHYMTDCSYGETTAASGKQNGGKFVYSADSLIKFYNISSFIVICRSDHNNGIMTLVREPKTSFLPRNSE